MQLQEKAHRILQQPVCDDCLGRQFAQLLSGMTNVERGRLLRTLIAMSIDKEHYEGDLEMSNFHDFKFHKLEMKSKMEKKKCAVCEDIFENLDKFVDRVVKASKKYEFSTFLVGTKLSFELISREENLWERVGIDYCEPIKAELNREIGKLFEKKSKAKYHSRPDINFIIGIPEGKVDVQINPLFIYGEYQKLIRGIPQTKWPSKKYKTSIEEIMAKPFMTATKGKGHRLHGCVAGNTNILLDECSLPISELEVGWKNHRIVTFNEKEKTIETSPIEDFMKINMETFKLKTKETGREIVASKEHPFYTPKGMLPLANLKKGDLVAINPAEPLEYSDLEEKIIVTEKSIMKVVERYIPTSYKLKIISELKERGLLPLKMNSKDIFILTRVLAFLFGDGTVRYIRKRDVGLEFYGTDADLKEIQNDLIKMNFYSAISKRKGKTTALIDYYGNRKEIKGTGIFRLTCYSKSLWTLLVALGVPVGNKTTSDFELPEWIKNADKGLKKEFLATLLGCEMDMPRLDKRKHNRKSFNTPRFSMNKIEAKLDNMLKFMSGLKIILSEFGINTLKIRLVPYTTRKDGNKSIKVILDFNNNFENLISLYSKINFRYCKGKESYSKYVLEYLLMKKHITDKRRGLFKKALELHKKGLMLSKIHKTLGIDYVSKKDLWLWLHRAKLENIKVPNSFPDFDVWLANAKKGLDGGLVWETIESVEQIGRQTVYDLTVPKNHNFFANGFLVSNCGREDIDARCLGWRPFVLEILEPQKRKINLKSLAKKIGKGIKVRNLRLSNIEEVRRIKEERADKTYRAIVICEDIKKDDLKKLQQLKEIKQKTPERVLHRRADKFRHRKLKTLKAKYVSNKKFELTMKCEAGLYVKELISGDNGRTVPSVSSILGQPCICKELDVIGIHHARSKK